MQLLPIENIDVDIKQTTRIKEIVESTLRLIAYSRQHLADDLLNAYISKTTSFKELLSIKNAQMEAQTEEEVVLYTKQLEHSLRYITNELKYSNNLDSEIQLFRLFRLIAPEAHHEHPNKYRSKMVQIGAYLCPKPSKVPSLVSDLFYNMNNIQNPIIKALYFHHELIRIHPFIDGNGRTTRMAKNWMLMYELYPPIFISGEEEKKEYIKTLEGSFMALNKKPNQGNDYIKAFFSQELSRLEQNVLSIFQSVENAGNARQL